MKVAIFNGKGDVTAEERPDPTIREPRDAIVRVVRSCVCGSDLWYYRGLRPHAEGSIGHEFIGVIEEVGKKVRSVKVGDLVISPFTYNDGTCINCEAGITSACINGGLFGDGVHDGGQGERVRVPFADATLVKVPTSNVSDETLAALLTLSDVMSTGYHAALSADVRQDDTVAVVGDGAVGLCAVIAAKLLGAKRIIALSRNPSRQALAKTFGATDIVPDRGEAAIKAVLTLTDNVGVDCALECVGSDEAMKTAVAIVRPGSMVGFVGVPYEVQVPVDQMFARNVGLHGGVASARVYIPELLDEVLQGRIHPELVFDLQTDLDHIQEAYAAMDERRAVKSLLRISEL